MQLKVHITQNFQCFFNLAFQMKCKYGVSNAIYYKPTIIDDDFYFQRMVVF